MLLWPGECLIEPHETDVLAPLSLFFCTWLPMSCVVLVWCCVVYYKQTVIGFSTVSWCCLWSAVVHFYFFNGEQEFSSLSIWKLWNSSKDYIICILTVISSLIVFYLKKPVWFFWLSSFSAANEEACFLLELHKLKEICSLLNNFILWLCEQ